MNANQDLKLNKAISDLKKYQGKDIVVLGSGSSLLNFDFDFLKSKNIIAINHSFKYCNPFALCVIDSSFIHREMELSNPEDYFQSQSFYSFFCTNARIFPKFEHSKVIKLRHSQNPKKEDLQNGKLYCQNLTGIMALHLAICLNPKNIYLLGYDCKTGVLTHFSDHEQPHEWRNGQNEANYLKNVPKFDMYSGYKNIINVCLESEIKAFPKISFQEFYKSCGT